VEEIRVQLPRNDNSIFLGSRGYCGSRRDRLATASAIVSGAVTCLRSARASARTCVASSRHRTSQPLTEAVVHQIPVIKSGRAPTVYAAARVGSVRDVCQGRAAE
jgi:hypothetical protein